MKKFILILVCCVAVFLVVYTLVNTTNKFLHGDIHGTEQALLPIEHQAHTHDHGGGGCCPCGVCHKKEEEDDVPPPPATLFTQILAGMLAIIFLSSKLLEVLPI
jgi:ABC-type nickel/cobalt efflux system permease component RcnA